jgi:hypothetical protein
MSDWADEKAMELLAFGMDEDDVADVAASLRQARRDALEEAARVAEKQEDYTSPRPNGVLRRSIAAAIRRLKDKA